MECIACKGNGCEQCNQTGKIVIDQCPMDLIDSEIWEFLGFADLYKKGLPPIAGGALDQAQNFLMACRFAFGEQAYWKAKLGILE